MIWDATEVLPDSVPYRHSFPVSSGFRKQLFLSEIPESVDLYIFADARYMIWINGVYVNRGPNRFDPKRVEYDTHTITSWLRKGKNSIAILVQGGLSNYRFIYHKPGLGVVVETKDKKGTHLLFATDTTWRSSGGTRFGQPVVLLSGIADNINENREKDDWIARDFADSTWKPAVHVDGSNWGEFCKRTIPLLSETMIEGAQIIKIIHDSITYDIKRPVSEAIPLELIAPATVLVDIGQMVRAWFEIDFEPESESDIELIPSQSFSGRDEGYLGVCHYKTTALSGQRKYITTDDFTCRLVYIKLNSGKIRLNGLKVVERRYPFDLIGDFRCNDEFLNELWKMSMRTSEVNATDGYIDGSEGGEWVTGEIDYPVTEVAFSSKGDDGTPVYSDMRLLKNQISRMALSQEGDELIKGWHPSDWHKGPRDQGSGIHNFIEDNSAYWINLLRIYYDGTGDSDFVKREWPVLEKLITWFLDRRTEHGLVYAREFFLHFDNPIAYNYCEGATLNAMIYGSLVDASWLAEKLGKKNLSIQYSNAALELAEAYNKYLWDAQSGTYYAGLKKGEKKLLSPWPHEPWKYYYESIDQNKEFFPPTVQAAVMALHNDLVPYSRLESVQKYLLEHHHDFVSPFAYLYTFKAFYQMNTDEADLEVINTMRKRWDIMVALKMPGTLGETFSAESYYCHDFGPIPSAYLSSYVLGVRRDGPVWNKRIIIEPRLGDLIQAEGVVVTRHGPVPVEWKRTAFGGLDFRIIIPEGVTASVSIPRPPGKPSLKIDNKLCRKAKLTNRFLIVELGPGEHKGTIIP